MSLKTLGAILPHISKCTREMVSTHEGYYVWEFINMKGNPSSELTNKKFEWSQPIYDHAIEMSNLATKMKSMGMGVNYNTLKEI
ncbi:hypothetical protein CR513_57180, partial [Mucuna pruriens]